MRLNCVPNASSADFRRSWTLGHQLRTGTIAVFRSWIGLARFFVLENFEWGENPVQLIWREVVDQTNRFRRQKGVGFDFSCAGFLQRHAARVVRRKDFGDEQPAGHERFGEPIRQGPELRRAQEVQHGLGDDQVVGGGGQGKFGHVYQVGTYRCAGARLDQSCKDIWIALDGVDGEAALGEPQRGLSLACAQVEGKF